MSVSDKYFHNSSATASCKKKINKAPTAKEKLPSATAPVKSKK